jgi:hypothetical protein
MTPAGLPAEGSVLCTTALPSATALCTPTKKASTPRAQQIDTSLMATNVNQPTPSDVAKSLPSEDDPGLTPLPPPSELPRFTQRASPSLHSPERAREGFPGGAREGSPDGLREGSPDGAREGSIWLVAAPTALVLTLLLLATVYAGAFNVGQWAPPALFILIVLLTLLLRGGLARLPDRWLALALMGAWGLAAWAVLSATWAASPGAALEQAGRLTMYAAVLTLPILAVGAIPALRVAGRGVVGGIALIALYALLEMLLDGPSIFLAGRLNGPVEYRNATALLFCIAYWPLIVTAATRDRPRGLRAVCFGLAELMLGLAFLTQSRGVLFGLGCGALVVLLLGPDRTRRAWLALLSLALLAGASSRLLVPYHAFIGGGPVTGEDIAGAGGALAVLTGAAVATGFLMAVFDAGLRPVSSAVGRIRLGARLGLLAVLLVGLAGGVVAVHGRPVNELRVKWQEFKSLQTTSTSATRYTSAGGQRYDLWRVALEELRHNPVGGVGAASYQFGYYRQRRTNRNLEDPHGLLFQLGAELGLVGLLLFALILVGILGSLRRWWRVAPPGVRRSVGGLAAAGATFVGQSLVDWMWRIPGLTSLGLLCLGVAAALLARTGLAAREEERPLAGVREDDPLAFAGQSRRPMRRDHGAHVASPARLAPRSLAGRAAAAAALLGAVALTLSLYLSDSYVRRSRDEIGRSPAAQLADARTASSLDPWSTAPHYLQASALESMGMRYAARAQLEDAHRMEPTSSVPLGLLGDLEARGGNYSRARADYRRALALDPLDAGLQQLALTGGRPRGS